MSKLVETAFAKLNLALHVRGKLPDGRHGIETIFAFCEDGDRLSVEPSDSLSLSIDGPFAGDLEGEADNLILQAARALQQKVESGQGAALFLTKNLPIASGIGGGSADAGAALRLLGRFWGVADYETVGAQLGYSLGSDVPACVLSKTARGSGSGQDLQLLDGSILAGRPVLLINPGMPLSTRAVYEGWNGVDRGNLFHWEDGRNDLEASAIALVPEISGLLDWLRAQPGAAFARMSGSGATCFALFDSDAARDAAAKAVPPDWWHLASRLR